MEPEKFKLHPLTEQVLKGNLAGFIERLIDPAIRLPMEMEALSRALFWLRQLPLKTNGIYGTISISIRANKESQYAELAFTDDGLEIISGGNIDSGSGSDSYSEVELSLLPGYENDIDEYKVRQWIGIARSILSAGGKLEIEGLADEELYGVE